MADILEVIASLRAEIALARRDIEDKESALRVLESRFTPATSIAAAMQTPALPVQHDDGELFNLSDLVTPDSARRRTFLDDLRDVLRRFGGQEFGIGHAEAALRKIGVEIAGKTPRSRISASLSKLSDEGFIVKTFEGGGNVPHRYRVRASMTDAEFTQYTSQRRAGVGLRDADGQGTLSRELEKEEE